MILELLHGYTPMSETSDSATWKLVTFQIYVVHDLCLKNLLI